MLNPAILITADVLVAILLSLGFLTAYLINRRLTTFSWWSGFFLLVTVPIGTTGIRMQYAPPWVESASWICLYGALALVAHGTYRQGESRIRPYRAILAGAAALAVIIVVLSAVNAPPAIWMIWGTAPTVAFGLWAGIRFLGQRPLGVADWSYGLILLGGVAVIAIRSVWFADLFMSLGQNPERAPTMDSAVIMSLTTILTMIVLAIALILRMSFATINRMQERSNIDALSGLLNRATFDEQAGAALHAPGSQDVCAVMLDIDHFKRINDTFGHQTGDYVISCLGRVILANTDERQIAGRIGGEEFAIVLRDSNLPAGRLFAEAIRTRFANCDAGKGIAWPLTLSAGVAMRENDEPLHALVARADKALYAAKKRGRNCVMVASVEPVDTINAQRA